MTKRLPNSFSETNIKAVWTASRDKKAATAGSPGIDGITAQQFGSKLPENIAHIRDLVRNDAYKFSRLRAAPIPKKSGGDRIIAVPTVQDRLVQRVILNHLENDKNFYGSSPIAYGFRKGRSLQDAQSRALELRGLYPWVVQADIVKFFDNIDRKIIKLRVKRGVRNKVIRSLLESAIDCELDYSNPKANFIAKANGIKERLGLRQGMPLSPLLSNLLLKEFDRAVSNAGIAAVRYADDIAIFAASKNACLEALNFVRIELKALKLEIPELEDESKTVICQPTAPVEFLGVDIKHFEDGYRLCVPRKRLAKIEEHLIEVSTVEYCIQNKITMIRALIHMESFLVGHSRSLALVSDHDQFVARLNALRVKYIDRLLVSVLGKKVAEGLPAEKRAVLGLQSFA